MTTLPEPSWRLLLGRGLPTVALEGFLPVALFYGVWRSTGALVVAVVASTAAAGLAALWQARRGADGALAAATCVFIVIQAVVGLAADSALVYLAQPVLVSACWGVAYLVSVAIGRPLIGAFARGWYPFPREFREGEAFRSEFGMQSLVWGVYCLAASAVRLTILLTAGIGAMVAVTFVAGTVLPAGLAVWGVWHARRAFSEHSPEAARGGTSGGVRHDRSWRVRSQYE